MIGTLMLMDSGRWAIVARERDPYEITAGEVFGIIDGDGRITVTRMEFARGPGGGRYVSVDDIPLREGLRVADGRDLEATPDEIAGMDWWNGLTDLERAHRFSVLERRGQPVTAAQAWAAEKAARGGTP